MPLLQFDTTLAPTDEEVELFSTGVRDRYAEIMETTTGHIAVTVRSHDPGRLSIGRQVDDDRLLFLDAEIRAGRSVETKREFAVSVMDFAAELFGVPDPNMKVVFTEHDGPDMMGYTRVGDAWSDTEAI